MFMKFFLAGVVSAASLASVRVETHVREVEYQSLGSLAGIVTFWVEGNDFQGASAKEPIYLRLTFDHQTSLLHTQIYPQTAPSVFSEPINLALRCANAQVVAPGSSVQIVRWIKSESSLWIRITEDTSKWLIRDGALASPDMEHPVGFTVGISGEQSLRDNLNLFSSGHANLPSNSRGGEPMFTSIALFLANSSITTTGRDSLLHVIPSVFDSETQGVLSETPILGNQLSVNFTEDIPIARGVVALPEQRLFHVTPAYGAFRTQITLRNPSDHEEALWLWAYDSNGNLVSADGYDIQANSFQIWDSEELLRQYDVSHIVAVGPRVCTVTASYRIKSGYGASAHIQADSYVGLAFTVYMGESEYVFDGVAAVNLGDQGAQVVARYLDEEGDLLYSQIFTEEDDFPPNTKRLWVLDELAPQGTKAFSLTSTQPLGSVFLRGTRPGVEPGYLYEVRPLLER
ncbi:MAG: hypothetical protein KDC35_21350 [Acidobacteria bacterium]|nr:hypothetical protein [Acidobacteriota bacterium]